MLESVSTEPPMSKVRRRGGSAPAGRVAPSRFRIVPHGANRVRLLLAAARGATSTAPWARPGATLTAVNGRPWPAPRSSSIGRINPPSPNHYSRFTGCSPCPHHDTVRVSVVRPGRPEKSTGKTPRSLATTGVAGERCQGSGVLRGVSGCLRVS
jgi:hypothetical protein